MSLRWTRVRGLSPRVRGNPRQARRNRHRPGSIPACAGEPKSRYIIAWIDKVYPRVCGGTIRGRPRAPQCAGLSPRVRGNRGCPIAASATVGSIPACAGEPRRRVRAGRVAGVYPRVCGGTGQTELRREYLWGLSPRVRGNRARVAALDAGAGSIPACAGEPARSTGGRRPPRVYPRVCGGTVGASPPRPHATGLSPRVRGNLRSGSKRALAPRSIPACAGEPRSWPGRSRQ